MEALESLVEAGNANETALLHIAKHLKLIHAADNGKESWVRKQVVIEYALSNPYSLHSAPEDVIWFCAGFLNRILRKKKEDIKSSRKTGLVGEEFEKARAYEERVMSEWISELIEVYISDHLTIEADMIRDGIFLLLEADSATFAQPLLIYLQKTMPGGAKPLFKAHEELIDEILEMAPCMGPWAFPNDSGEHSNKSKK
jgi:hypothetical protein